jgi:hypothetical protein
LQAVIVIIKLPTTSSGFTASIMVVVAAMGSNPCNENISSLRLLPLIM